MFVALLIGLISGFVGAVPVAGPISAIVFKQGIRGRYSKGRWVALGAAFAESGYAFLAFIGFNHVLANQKHLLNFSNALAALILGVLGVYFFRSKKLRTPAVTSVEVGLTQGSKAFLTGVSVTAINVSLLVTWTTAITALSSFELFESTLMTATFFSLGVGVGIFAWFALLLMLLGKYKGHFSARVFDLGLKGVGTALVSLSLAIVWKLIAN